MTVDELALWLYETYASEPVRKNRTLIPYTELDASVRQHWRTDAKDLAERFDLDLTEFPFPGRSTG